MVHLLSVCGLLIETIRGQRELLIAYFACAIVTLTRSVSLCGHLLFSEMRPMQMWAIIRNRKRETDEDDLCTVPDGKGDRE